MWKGGQNLQSGWLTHLVDQHICWCGWCCLAVPFVVSVLFDDKICWYGQAFRINILCNRPILLMEQIMLLSENLRCAKVAVQLLQCSLHCAMWPVYICKVLQYILHCLFICLLLLFVCCVSYVYCISLEQLLCPWDGPWSENLKKWVGAVSYLCKLEKWVLCGMRLWPQHPPPLEIMFKTSLGPS